MPFVGDLCPEAKKQRKIWVDFVKTNWLKGNLQTALSSLFAALQIRPQLFKEQIVISYPADKSLFKGQHISTCIISVVRSLDISSHPATIQRIKLISTSR